jgi:hypothetical protein
MKCTHIVTVDGPNILLTSKAASESRSVPDGGHRSLKPMQLAYLK